jgi:predicted nucleic acid-binding protein
MRVVVDTNVFVSAALKDKSFPAVALHVVARRGTLLKSTLTERQLFAVLARPHIAALIDAAAADWMRKLMAAAQAVTDSEPPEWWRCPKR